MLMYPKTSKVNRLLSKRHQTHSIKVKSLVRMLLHLQVAVIREEQSQVLLKQQDQQLILKVACKKKIQITVHQDCVQMSSFVSMMILK